MVGLHGKVIVIINLHRVYKSSQDNQVDNQTWFDATLVYNLIITL